MGQGERKVPGGGENKRLERKEAGRDGRAKGGGLT